MHETWYIPGAVERDGTSVTGSFVIPDDSPWLSGHFPGDPILPGIAQLGIVFDLVRSEELGKGRTIRISQIKRVRFKQIIRPGDPCTLLVTSEKEGTYGFRIMVGETIAATGSLYIESDTAS